MNEIFLVFVYLFFEDNISLWKWNPAGLEYLIFLLQFILSPRITFVHHPVKKITIKKYFHNFDMTV